MTHNRRTTTLVLTTLLLTTSLVAAIPTALANHNVDITSPANGAILQRGVATTYSALAAMGTSPATCTSVFYSWNIGGAVFPGQTVSYAFPLSTPPGLKTVTVTATYTGASHCGNVKTASISVDVRNVAPTASLALPSSAVAGASITADGSASSDVDGTIPTYRFTVDGVAYPAQSTPTLPLTFTTAGTHTVTLSVVDNNGGTSGTASGVVQVAPAALATITVDGPSVLVAGTSGTYTLAGADAYGNAVPLSQTTLVHTAGVSAGQETVSYSESGVTGEKVIDVVADVLDFIHVDGPSTLVVGTSATYDLSGVDQYGNPVPLTQTTLYVTAPTTAGAFDVTYEESGVTGTASVMAIAGSLATITLDGPEEVVVGHAATYSLQGADAYGNPVMLSQATLEYVAGTWAGTEWLCYDESGVQGCAFVTRIPDAPVTLLYHGMGIVTAGETYDYDLYLYDQHWNLVRHEVIQSTASTTAGYETVVFELDGLTATLERRVDPDVIANLWIEGPTTVTADDVTMLIARGTDQYGNPVVFYDAIPYRYTETAAGSYSWTVNEGGLTATHAYQVTAGALRSITLHGPSEMLVNTTATFTVEGRDAHGNEIPMDPSTIEVTAPTWAGTYYHMYEVDGVWSQTPITLLPDAVARVSIHGWPFGTVGQTLDFTAVAYDQYWNLVRSQPFTYDVPTQAGFYTVTYTLDDIEGWTMVIASADVLARVELSGPTMLVAGTTQTFTLSGFDQYDNPVSLSTYEHEYDVPTLVGEYEVSATVDGITGTLDVTVVPAALASIVVTGPDTLVAGGSGEYAYAGFDQYLNAVALETETETVPAPEQAGPIQVCHEEEGIEGCLDVLVVPDALATITLDGPTTLVVGTTQTYALSGGDRFGNPVVLAQETLDFTAPTTVGTTTVTYVESGITGSLVVDLVHGPVASVAVATSESVQNLGRAVSASALAYDAYGNGIPEAVFAWSATGGDIDLDGDFVGTSVGEAVLTATYDGVDGDATVLVVDTLGLALGTSQATYEQVDALSGVSGEGQLLYVDGAPVAGVTVVLTFTRPEGLTPAETMVAVTDDEGRFTFEAPAAARLYGTHTVTAAAADGSGNAGSGSATYSVTPLPAMDALPAIGL